MSNANILIGCGGSGIRSLMRLNTLLAEDGYWRHTADTDIYYLAIDTEKKMLDEFEGEVRRQFRGANRPYLKCLQISKGWAKLPPAIKQHLVDPFTGSKTAGLDRLKEHWWFDEAGIPFDAEFVSPLHEGAGQVPSVSYFLAWMKMEELEGAFDELITEVTRRRAGKIIDAAPLQNNNLIVVSGMAGGTGRGCWNLVTFKMRQLFQEKGPQNFATPVGFFVDASCFANVMKERPEQKPKLKINALTGFSELSAWMNQARKVPRQEQFRYRLPNIQRPGDPNADVVKVDPNAGDPTAVAPVTNAYIIARESENGLLERSDHAFEMIGSSLYAKITESRIGGQAINSAAIAYWGIGSATFEIPADSLRQFFEWDLRVAAIECLTKKHDVAVATTVTKFLDELQLVFRTSDVGIDQPESKGPILEKICASLIECYSPELDQLDQELKTDNARRAQAAAQTLKGEDEARASAAVDAAFAQIENGKSLADRIREAVFTGRESILAQTNSLDAACEALKVFGDELLARLTRLPANLTAPSDVDAAAEVKKSERREWWIAGRHFNADETKQIRKEARQDCQYSNFAAIHRALKRRLSDLRVALQQHITAAEALLSCAGTLRAEFAEKRGDRDRIRKLFTDPARPEDSVLEEFASERFFRRILRPVQIQLHDNVDFTRIADYLRIVLANEGGKIQHTENNRIGDLRAEFGEKLRNDVGPKDDVMNRYDFESVVAQLKDVWRQRFDAARNNSNDFERLRERFRLFFGVDVKKTGQGLIEFSHEREQFIWRMAASLAETCRPYWKLQSATQSHQVMIFLPVAATNDNSLQKFVQENVSHNVTVATIPLGRRDSGVDGDREPNPYIMFAYAAANTPEIENIRSFDYWQDAAIIPWLERAESIHGESIFRRSEGNMGTGYTDPLYVRNPILRNHRWKPWDQGRVIAEQSSNEVFEALAYALLEPVGAIAEKLAALGWKHPLLRVGDRETYNFTRMAYLREGNTTKADYVGSWPDGQRLAQSIRNVVKVLTGETTPPGLKEGDGVAWRSRILAEARVFWDQLATPGGFGRGTVDGRAMLNALRERAGGLLSSAESEDAAIWRSLVAHLDRQ